MRQFSRRQLASAILSSKPAERKQRIKQVAAYLVESKKAKQLPLVLKELEYVAEREYSHAAAHVHSVNKIDLATQKRLVARIKQELAVTTVELIEEIDPSLLGGVRVTTAEREIDVSVAGKLHQLKELTF
jgi:F-type H+-transporting ATPase subunit delta